MTKAVFNLLWAGVRLYWACFLPMSNLTRARAYERFDAALDHLLWLRWVAEHPEDA